jgi:dual specificity protein kinase YAK1
LPLLQSTDLSPEQYFPSSASSQLSAPFGSELKSPPTSQQNNHKQPPGRGPIPKFSSIKSMQEVKPRINTQPPFRRANPEGGFISVSGIFP